MTRSKASLLLLFLAGCFRTSPDAAVLAPLVAHFKEEPFDESYQPEYIGFADELTATVFKSLTRDPHYKIVPTGKPFVCPSDRSECRRSELGVRIDSLMGDSAIARIERTYNSEPGHPIRNTEQILLVRRNGRWRIERVLGYGASVLG